MSRDVLVAVLFLLTAFWAGFSARGFLDRLFVQELLRRKLTQDQKVTVDWNPTIHIGAPATPTDPQSEEDE